MGIGKSQFYKDKDALEEIGFKFEYSKARGFTILEDRLAPLTDLSLSDRIILMFALEHLNACGEGHLAAGALAVARKLAGGLDSPFREQLQESFDEEITSKSFGVQPDIWARMQTAVAEGRHLDILYQSAQNDWKTKWRRIFPRRLYFSQRSLYLYARDLDQIPAEWKVFRLSRIKEVKPTGICQQWRPDEDDGFKERQRNAFMSFLGEANQVVKIRFTGTAAKYVAEQRWHASQRLEPDGTGGLILTVSVAEPQEVIRWARQFGDGVEIM
ncbi:WYL domain-containing protein [Deltaproteobacteria bacterium OttesenSCG-928-K17]|nr:WYL domain-containing protein [Deltaproteobacteria bacterium OttesenSCG-928-K17]